MQDSKHLGAENVAQDMIALKEGKNNACCVVTAYDHLCVTGWAGMSSAVDHMGRLSPSLL